MNSKMKAILDRIAHLEDAIAKGHEYLEAGAHAHWRGFRPLFDRKVRDGKVLAPHRDWVRNVFLPRHERALQNAYGNLEALALSAVESAGEFDRHGRRSSTKRKPRGVHRSCR